MEVNPEQSEQHTDFPERIGEDHELWQKYHEVHGKEAYKYRRLYEEASRQLTNLYKYAEEHSIDLPNPGPDFT
jgi:hypothetical protein